MKNLIVITLLISLCLLTACDKIHPPYTEECHQTAQKTVLIEKFTGHKCSNCPEATRKIDELKECYGDNLISISIQCFFNEYIWEVNSEEEKIISQLLKKLENNNKIIKNDLIILASYLDLSKNKKIINKFINYHINSIFVNIFSSKLIR